MINRAFSKILILVVFILIAGGGIFAWQYLGVPKEEVVENKTAEWQIYRNELLKFIVSYPKDWNIQTKQDPFPTVFIQSRPYNLGDVDPNTGRFRDTEEKLEEIVIEIQDKAKVESELKLDPDMRSLYLKEGFQEEDLTFIVDTDLRVDGYPVYKISPPFPVKVEEKLAAGEGITPSFSYLIYRGENAFLLKQTFPLDCTDLRCEAFKSVFSKFQFLK